MRYSASMIKTWMTCPLQAKFKKILDVPELRHAKTSYGSCMHDAIETYNTTGDLEAAVERFKEIWEDPSLIDAEIDLWPSTISWGELRSRGIRCLIKFDEDSKWESRDILAAEHKFVVPYGEHTMSGIIDSLELIGSRAAPKELRVVDYKTSSRTPTRIELRFDIQFTIYMYATEQSEFWEDIKDGEELFESLRHTPRRGLWYSLWNHKMTDVGPREDIDLMRLHRCMLEIEQAIEKEVYVPNISADSCMWCGYTDYCAVTIPLVEIVREARDERLK